VAIGFRAQTQIASGGATDPTSAPALPTGTQSGDMVVYGVIVKYASTTIATNPPTSWTDPTNNEANNTGLTDSGNDAGNIRVALFFREYDGVWTMPTIDLSGTPNCTMVGAISYSKGAGETWATPVCATAVDNTAASTGVDPAASGTTLDFATGDLLYAFCGVNGDAGTPTVPMTVAVTGVTFGAATTRWNATTSSGTDLRGHSIERAYTSGTASAGPDGVFTLTTGAASGAGVMVFARLRVTTAAVTGSGLGAFTFSGTAAGVPETFGTAAGSFAFTGTAAGVDRALGVAAGSFAFTATASGVVTTPQVEGQALGAFTFAATAAGVPETFGTATASFGFTGTAAGIDRALGSALAALTFTGTAAGIDRALGVATGSLAFTGTAAGVPEVFGVAASALTFTGTASGVIGNAPITGVATGAYAFTGTAAGIDRALGVAASSFAFTGAATGIDRALGVAAASFTVTATAAGTRRVRATALAAYVFDATIEIAVTEGPEPFPPGVLRITIRSGGS